MLRRLIAIATLAAPVACAGLLDLDPGTLRGATAEAGPDADPDTGTGVTTDGPATARGCSKALAPGVYCDDFDDPGRTDPSAREAKALEAPEKLSLVTNIFESSPRSLQAKYGSEGFPNAFLTTPERKVEDSFHLTMALRVARDGISQGDPFMVGEVEEVPGRAGRTYSFHLTPRQEAVELRLKQGSGVLAFHQKTIPYDEWHVISMRFQGRYAYLELDGDAVSEGVPELTGDYNVHFGLVAFAPVTVFLDNVEIGP